MSALGKILKTMRLSQQKSLKGLAPELDVTYTYLSKIENGKSVPSDELIKRMALVFGCDSEELMVSAGKIPEDILDILKSNPKLAIETLRKAFDA